MTHDLTTVAYMVKGALAALYDNRTATREGIPAQAQLGGELEFLTYVAACSVALDSAYEVPGAADALDGLIFAYDVAEPFGYALAERLIFLPMPTVEEVALFASDFLLLAALNA